MPSMEIYLNEKGTGLADVETMPLDTAALAAAPLRAGRDWLRIQGKEGVEALGAFVSWEAVGASAQLHVELRDAAGRRRWLGVLPAEELKRVAERGASALGGAGIWPRSLGRNGFEVLYKVALGAADPTPDRPLRLDAPAAGARSMLGIEVGLPEAAPLPPIVPREMLAGTAPFLAEERPEILVVLPPDAPAAIRELCQESARAREERALVFYGVRGRTPVVPAIPVFLVEEVVRPALLESTSTSLVFAPDALVRGGRTPVGILHTHLPAYGLEPSDRDRRDIEDLDPGGPGAFSAIAEASAHVPAGALPPLKFHARLGARGGVVAAARVRLVAGRVGAPAAAETRP